MKKYFLKRRLNRDLYKYMRADGVLETISMSKMRSSYDDNVIEFHIPPWTSLNDKVITYQKQTWLADFIFKDRSMKIRLHFTKSKKSDEIDISYDMISAKALKMYFDSNDPETRKLGFFTILKDLGF